LRLFAAAAALALASCAGGGFSRPADGELKLGETTQAEVLARMGAPATRGSTVRNGQPIDALVYEYVSESEAPHGYEGVIARRTLNLFFHDGRLAGHEFSSSVASDHTDFDLRKMKTIAKGATTRAGVTALLGRPSGYLGFPVVKVPGGQAMLYAYRENRRVPFGAPMAFTKTLLITFDESGVVNDLSYTTSGSR
jgi:hypothetical protein